MGMSQPETAGSLSNRGPLSGFCPIRMLTKKSWNADAKQIGIEYNDAQVSWGQ
jgi:hypothetical protein